MSVLENDGIDIDYITLPYYMKVFPKHSSGTHNFTKRN